MERPHDNRYTRRDYLVSVTVCTGILETGLLFEFTCGGQQGIVVSRTEFFLDARHVGYFVKADICTEVYTETTLAFTAFRGNHHNTVGCFRSVQGRCGGTFQDRDAFDIFPG